MGIVQQDVFLFSDSVADNIGYGRDGASREEIEEAARMAAADGFIRALPHGYDTEVGERGVKLSGGQKQRISIARVFLKDPPVLIWDEATAALDTQTEEQIQETMSELSKTVRPFSSRTACPPCVMRTGSLCSTTAGFWKKDGTRSFGAAGQILPAL